ncbi:uncharacterized protein LOC123472391 [Daphnia magna]|uniref:uncharacterized protein LOC123472391 n=1 Tax=Daphnia magna TaxID=35525 RepID=UPI001E1BC37A|nr:uncharacterized protein LOC123472391 [Daphnia magna]
MDLSRRLDIKHIDKFDGTNYQQWKHGLLMELELVELLDIVEGYEQCPDEIFADDANFEDENNYPIPTNIGALKEWRKKDCIARTMIYHTNDKERQKGQDSYKKNEKLKGGSLKATQQVIVMKMVHLLASIILTDKTITEGRLRSARTVLTIPITGPETADL